MFLFCNVFSLQAQNIAEQISEDTTRMNLYTGRAFGKNIMFTDTSGKKISLAAFQGKVCYIDLWFVGCAPCANEIPFWKQRFDHFAGDTNLAFITIAIPVSKQHAGWRRYIRDNQIPGIHLTIAPELLKTKTAAAIAKALLTDEYPSYYILDKNGLLAGNKVSIPSDKLITDYILYNALKSVAPSKSYVEIHSELSRVNSKTASPAFVSWVESFYKKPFMGALSEALQ